MAKLSAGSLRVGDVVYTLRGRIITVARLVAYSFDVFGTGTFECLRTGQKIDEPLHVWQTAEQQSALVQQGKVGAGLRLSKEPTP